MSEAEEQQRMFAMNDINAEMKLSPEEINALQNMQNSMNTQQSMTEARKYYRPKPKPKQA